MPYPVFMSRKETGYAKSTVAFTSKKRLLFPPAVGLAMQNVAMGVAFGTAFGVAVGALLTFTKAKND